VKYLALLHWFNHFVLVLNYSVACEDTATRGYIMSDDAQMPTPNPIWTSQLC